eukprot:TRINITY_DN15216_c0_g1_i1.p1 TRINITY_DN15216_c0_g1~~TRINITY_DN15216_c0_g1_i1.p1  ORF type:complete len:264 (+),score=31.99 TRINITY_DN15216_c0_g1_i1:462-1253(+)
MTAKIVADMPKMFIQRHRLNLAHPDTYEIAYNVNYCALGPHYCYLSGTFDDPYGVDLEQEEEDVACFVEFVHHMFQLTASRAGTRRPFIKGHFIYAAHQLHQRYPQATFVTVMRDPIALSKSMANFYFSVGAMEAVMINFTSGYSWTSCRFMTLHILRWYLRREIDFYAEAATTPKNRKLVLNFEDVIAEPREALKAVFTAAGLSVSEAGIHEALARRTDTSIKRAGEAYEVDLSCEDRKMNPLAEPVTEQWMKIFLRAAPRG